MRADPPTPSPTLCSKTADAGVPSDRDALVIDGPCPPLCGVVQLAGAKNAALPMMVAAAASQTTVQLANVPHGMRDIDRMARLLAVEQKLAGSADDDAAQLRASLVLLGLAAYRGEAISLPRPGGCAIGARPYDIHLAGLRALGAVIEEDDALRLIPAPLRGATITFPLPSTTATQNVVLAACAAAGETELRNANTRPENLAFFAMLRALGADIEWEPRLVRIRGPRQLGADLRTPPHLRVPSGGDEALTWLIAAAITGGKVTVEPIDAGTIAAELDALRQCGVSVHIDGERVTAAGRPTRAVQLSTGPPPGVGSDMQPLFGALATAAPGVSHITDLRFTERFQYLEALQHFGVDARARGNTATIVGGIHRSARTAGADLRGAMAAVLTALGAPGRSVIGGLDHLSRGYLAPDETLRSLGAPVTRCVIVDPIDSGGPS